MPYKDREAHRAYQKKYYQDHKGEAYERTRSRNRLFRRICQEIKSTFPCVDCKTQYPYYVMQFDHLPDTEKRFQMGDLGNCPSVSALLEEIDKCEVVCANCHAKRTFDREPSAW